MQQELIALSDDSKVWIYQSHRELSLEEVDTATAMLDGFLTEWTSHGHALRCYGNIFHRRHVVICVDESHAAASGCSIDSQVHFIKTLGTHLDVDFFDRMNYTYMIDDEVFPVHHNELSDLYQQNKIHDDTLFFDNLVKTKKDFIDVWLKPLKDSWHSRFI